MEFGKIVLHVEVRGDSTLFLRFADGSEGLLDYAPVISLGGMAGPLAEQTEFSQVRLGQGGRWIEWPCGFDACADALWEKLRKSTVHAA